MDHEAASKPPVVAEDLNPRNNMPAANQRPGPDQRIPLPVERVQSTIPKADFNPAHQAEASRTWVYPSEQMFYNAMKRKGWQPKEEDMASVVAIHNTVNEECWRQILAYEQLHCECQNPRLISFSGRPKDYSPKARFLNFLGYKLPFDRHDWLVDRCGTEVRYVIDFYNGTPQNGQPIAMHLDVRPALDSFSALFDRLQMQAKWTFSGDWMGLSPPNPSSDGASR